MESALGNSLDSYIPLVPFISAYLVATDRRRQPVEWVTSWFGALVTGVGGGCAMAAALLWPSPLATGVQLSLLMLAYVAFLWAGGFAALGSRWMRSVAFPVAFLLFVVPLPEAVVSWIEHGLVIASTDASELLLMMSGTPVMRTDTVLALPGVVLRVAQECSGIRSTWILFITSLVAANMFLETTWRRFILIAFVVPLGIVRNGFRILVIALLCVHIGPHMIDSAIHRHGGPVFFALSLVPLLLVLAWLRRQERGIRVERPRSAVSTSADRPFSPPIRG